MNLNKPMASSLWLSHILNISNSSINKKINQAINILKKHHILNNIDIKKNFIKTSYFYKKEHTCFLLSRAGCDYLITTLHLSITNGINLVQKLNDHFKHPENKLKDRYKKSIRNLDKYTLSYAFAQLQSIQLGENMSTKKGFYLLQNLGCINQYGLPTAFMQQSGLYKILMGWTIKHRKLKKLQIIKNDSHKYELKNMNYLQLLQQQIFSYIYDLNNCKFTLSSQERKLKSKLITLGDYIKKCKSLHDLLANSNITDLRLLLFVGYNMEQVGQQRIVSYQATVLKDCFNQICKFYLHHMPSVDSGLDSINTIIHGGIIK